MSFKRTLMIVLAAGVVFSMMGNASHALLINGDFSQPDDLEGFVASGSVISEPGGEFALLETDGSFIRTLEQSFLIPTVATHVSFDFAFSTEGTPNGLFPDSFAASLTTAAGDFLDFFVVDYYGPIPDPSDGFESVTGAFPIDVTYDDSISIDDFTPLSMDDAFSGRVSLWLPEEILGQQATLFFDLFDEYDGVASNAAVDNIRVAPVPEPATLLLVGGGLLGMLAIRKRRPYAGPACGKIR